MSVRLLLIDNYDSFTYNLVQRLGEYDPELALEVYRNDKITIAISATGANDAILQGIEMRNEPQAARIPLLPSHSADRGIFFLASRDCRTALQRGDGSGGNKPARVTRSPETGWGQLVLASRG